MTAPDNPEEPTSFIRVFIANLSGDVADRVVTLVQAQHDMVLMQQVQGTIEILLAAQDADVLILGASPVFPPPGMCSHLLSEHPDLRIVVMTPNGDQSMLYWRGLQRRWLDSHSPTTIVATIRHSYQLNATI